MSRDTWDFDKSRGADVQSILDWCEEKVGMGRDGITISGGEPFDQPGPFRVLLEGLREILDRAARPVDLLVYSGRKFGHLEQHHPGLLEMIDAVIAGPFMQGRPTAKPWMGSDNQEIIPLSGLGHERYAALPPGTGRGRMQIKVDEGGIWMIGVPEIGEMEQVQEGLAARGITLGGSSWQA